MSEARNSHETRDSGSSFGASRAPKYPRYRAEKMQDFFIVSERCVRGFSYVYRNTGMGRFATREEAQAAIPKGRA